MNLLNLLGGNLVGKAASVVGSILTNKMQDGDNAHTEQMAVHDAFASEFGYIDNRTWWDSLVDGINRLVRPLFTFGTLFLFAYCIYNPSGFAVSVQALALIPGAMWGVMAAIVAFWFGGKYIQDWRKPKPISAKELAIVLGNMETLKNLDKGEE